MLPYDLKPRQQLHHHFYMVDANYIISYPIKSCHQTELLKAYTYVYQYLQIRRYRPQLHKLDKEASKDIEKSIAQNNTKLKYTPPDIHCTNPAECAIRTWKNHFTAIRAWCKDLKQTDITLDMMRPNTQNPNLSAHKSKDRMLSYATPMAPIGTECMIHIKPNQCHTWGIIL